MKTALLIIDVQTGLCRGEEAAFEIEQVTARINSISTKARVAGVPVVLIQHEEDDGLLKFGDAGWQLAPDLKTRPEDLRIRKKAPDSFHDTGLSSLLESRGITRLVICGLQTDCCINATVRRALDLGYEVSLVADGHSTVGNGDSTASEIIARHNATFANLTIAGRCAALSPAAEVLLVA